MFVYFVGTCVGVDRVPLVNKCVMLLTQATTDLLNKYFLFHTKRGEHIKHAWHSHCLNPLSPDHRCSIYANSHRCIHLVVRGHISLTITKCIYLYKSHHLLHPSSHLHQLVQSPHPFTLHLHLVI